MKKRTKSIFAMVLCLTVLVSFQTITYAAETWSNSATYDLDHDTYWKRQTSKGTYLSNQKTTESKNVSVYTVSKTMSSHPKFRIVNSENKERSGHISTPAADKHNRLNELVINNLL